MQIIGRLDRRIEIQTISDSSSNALGEPSPATWSTTHNVAASKTEVGGREPFQASERYAKQDVVFRIRYISGIKAKQRILCEGRYFNILGTKEIGRREALDIMCESLEVA